MERDFMGLNSKEISQVVVKEEVSDGVKDSGSMKVTGSQWPFANKPTTIPHFMRHISPQDNSSNKIAVSPIVSSGFPQNFTGFPVKQSHVPMSASIAGLVDPWNKSAGSPPAQMTIFYNGVVKVYDSITPEKAQAIMFLAGNGTSRVNNEARTGAQVRPPTPKRDATEATPANLQVNNQASSAISSPISVSSHNGAQSVSGSTNTDDMLTTKPTPISFAPDRKMDAPKPIPGLVSASPSMIPRGIPQFRKVSLARFLEKRKERAINAAPYNGAKKPEFAA